MFQKCYEGSKKLYDQSMGSLEGFYSGVYPVMSLQVRQITEPLRTRDTLVGPLAGVGPLVGLEMVRLAERLPATRSVTSEGKGVVRIIGHSCPFVRDERHPKLAYLSDPSLLDIIFRGLVLDERLSLKCRTKSRLYCYSGLPPS